MADREPVELLDFIPPEIYTELETVIAEDNLVRFKALFTSEDQLLNPEDTLWSLPLLFFAAGCGDRHTYYSPKIVEYLVEEKGADVNRMSMYTKAEKYSQAYRSWYDYDDDELEEDNVYTSVLMNLVLDGNIEACNYFFNHGADLDLVTLDLWENPIEGETALSLAENKLLKIEESFRWGIVENMWFEGSPEYLTKERIKVARGIKWLRYITVDENIPKLQASWQNRARLRHVLRGAPRTGRLEAEYMMSFLPKPAKFQKPSNINLRKINTTLFEGGRTRKRKQRKQRKSRSAK